VTEAGREEESVVRLARVGFSNLEGYLQGGFEEWKKAGEKTDMIINIEADELAMDIPHDPNLQVIDVRREAEFADGHVKGAINIPLHEMTDVALIAGLEEHQNLYVHCGSGFRSTIACSLMKAHGLNNIRNVLGGWAKIKGEKSIAIAREPSVLN
jgi:rhodanese-related sulfurtransferase